MRLAGWENRRMGESWDGRDATMKIRPCPCMPALLVAVFMPRLHFCACTTCGCLYAETTFLETLRNLAPSYTPIWKPRPMPHKMKCAKCESRYVVC